jgi:hemerythrin superfamily protein
MTALDLDHAYDVVGYLKQQHQLIKNGMERVIGSMDGERDEAFTALRQLIAVHETAEEEIVHPQARREFDDGEAVIKARLEEEHEGKQALAELEKLDIESTEFQTKFRQFQSDVLAHAEAEEREEFDRLPDRTPGSNRQRPTSSSARSRRCSTARATPSPNSSGADTTIRRGADVDRNFDLQRGIEAERPACVDRGGHAR